MGIQAVMNIRYGDVEKRNKKDLFVIYRLDSESERVTENS